MPLSRRGFLKGLVGTAAGVLVAPEILAEPERRVYALDRTMVWKSIDVDYRFMRDVPPWVEALEPCDTPLTKAMADMDYNYVQRFDFNWGDVIRVDNEVMWVGHDTIERAQAGTEMGMHRNDARAYIIGNARPLTTAELMGLR